MKSLKITRLNLSRSLMLLMAAAFLFSQMSCARMGIREKVAVVCLSAGTAGAIVAQQSRMSALGNAAGSLVPISSAAAVIQADDATADQVNRANQVGRSYVARITPAKRDYYKKKKIRYIAVKTSGSKKSRGTSVMVYDLEKKKVASPKVYDVRVEPESGTSLKFDTYVTEYVGD